MRIFLTGATGQLGIALRHVLRDQDLVAPSEAEADITDASIVARIADARPEVVIHAAAYTDVDGAESNPDRAYAVNADGTRNVAQGAAKVGARLVAISTDYVYDGTKTTPYREEDPVAPRSAYGASKLAGEREALLAKPDAVILRTAWLYGEGKNFVRTILRLASERDELRVVSDQVGSPTAADDLAAAIRSLLDTRAAGIYHAVNSGSCSWHEFAVTILDLAGYNRRVVPIASTELARPAPRPAYSILDCTKLARLGIRLRPWQAALADYLRAQPSGA
ncbi:MAG: dTDP-4-dehydrorhamnose reductase [Nitrospirota bacterium]